MMNIKNYNVFIRKLFQTNNAKMKPLVQVPFVYHELLGDLCSSKDLFHYFETDLSWLRSLALGPAAVLAPPL